jgi:hypothetical protein
MHRESARRPPHSWFGWTREVRSAGANPLTCADVAAVRGAPWLDWAERTLTANVATRRLEADSLARRHTSPRTDTLNLKARGPRREKCLWLGGTARNLRCEASCG